MLSILHSIGWALVALVATNFVLSGLLVIWMIVVKNKPFFVENRYAIGSICHGISFSVALAVFFITL